MPEGSACSQFGQSEVENFYAAIFGDEQIFGLEVAMDDAFFVGRRQAVRNLQRVIQSLACSIASHRSKTLAQRLAFQQFGDDVRRAFMRADVEYRKDVGMVQRRGGQCLLLKAAQAVRVAGNSERQNLEGDFPFETSVTSPIDFAHAPRTERANDLIRAKFRSRSQIHSQARVSPQGTNRTSLTDAG